MQITFKVGDQIIINKVTCVYNFNNIRDYDIYTTDFTVKEMVSRLIFLQTEDLRLINLGFYTHELLPITHNTKASKCLKN